MDVAVKSIALDGRGIFEYAERGEGPVTVLMLHGYLDSWYSFHGMMLAMPEGIRQISLSQRGHGESPKPEVGYSIADYAEDAIAFMEAMELGPVILVGHSMGTFIAQEVTLRRPEWVSQLFLIASGMTGNCVALKDFHTETLSFSDPMPRDFGYEFQAGTCVNPLGEGMELSRIVDETMKVPARVWDKALAGLIEYRPQEPESKSLAIDCPTLIIWGDKDEIFLRETQDDLVGAIQGASLLVLEGVGHGVQWEHPKRCALALREFCHL